MYGKKSDTAACVYIPIEVGYLKKREREDERERDRERDSGRGMD